jgi:hypothetical protein
LETKRPVVLPQREKSLMNFPYQGIGNGFLPQRGYTKENQASTMTERVRVREGRARH